MPARDCILVLAAAIPSIAGLTAQNRDYGHIASAAIAPIPGQPGAEIRTCLGNESDPFHYSIQAGALNGTGTSLVTAYPATMGVFLDTGVIPGFLSPSHGEVGCSVNCRATAGLPANCNPAYRAEYVMTVTVPGLPAGQTQAGFLSMRYLEGSQTTTSFGAPDPLTWLTSNYAVDVGADGSLEFAGVQGDVANLTIPVQVPSTGLRLRFLLDTQLNNSTGFPNGTSVGVSLMVHFTRVHWTPEVRTQECLGINNGGVRVRPFRNGQGDWEIGLLGACAPCAGASPWMFTYWQLAPLLPTPIKLPVTPFCPVHLGPGAVPIALSTSLESSVVIPPALAPLEVSVQAVAFDSLGVFTSAPFRFGVVY